MCTLVLVTTEDKRIARHKMRTIYLFGILLTLSIIAISCKSPTAPVGNTPPGKSNYVWSIDSVDYGSRPSTIQLESIWGSSDTSVWGANGDAPDVRDCLWHYNGTDWSRATAGTPITQNTGNKVVYCVWGTAQNNVWAFGRKINGNTLSAFIMHYDGSQWGDATPPNVQALPIVLYDVYGVSSNDIWVGGYEYALHYDGSQWQVYDVADSMTVVSITGSSGNMFFECGSPWGKDLSQIYSENNGAFKLIEEAKTSEDKFGGLLWANDGQLISFTNGIISTTIGSNGNINTSGWHRELTTPTYFSARYVQSSKNAFAVGQWNLAYHYNGTVWEPVNIDVPGHPVDPYALFFGVWTDGSQVFICDTQNGIVYHGR